MGGSFVWFEKCRHDWIGAIFSYSDSREKQLSELIQVALPNLEIVLALGNPIVAMRTTGDAFAAQVVNKAMRHLPRDCYTAQSETGKSSFCKAGADGA